MDVDISGLLANLFREWCGSQAVSVIPLPGSGSYRRYYRIKGGGRQVIGAFNNDERENNAFIYLGKHLLATGIKVPEIYATDPANKIYLVEDLGDVTLHDHVMSLKNEDDSDKRITELYMRVIDAMPALQVQSSSGIDYSQCYPRAEFDSQSIMWDLHYFKYSLLKPLRIKFYEQDLEDDFNLIVKFLCNARREYFMFRDFQSRNIMLHDGGLYFIDFQGGRKGPLQYDLASVLFEAKTSLAPEVRETLLEYYLETFGKNFKWFSSGSFLEYYYGFVYLRLMQAMGAYGFRGLTEHKPLFLQSLPGAVKIVSWLGENHPFPLELKCLPDVFLQLEHSPSIPALIPEQGELTVTIKSFSYRNGIPPDTSPDGGGFVFDCRSVNNPGRIEEFQNMTGLDMPVRNFLDSQPDAVEFFKHTSILIDNAVNNYLKRKFTNLSVSFGCTGGRHRSVYMTERLAGFLKSKYSINIVIRHTEIDGKADR